MVAKLLAQTEDFWLHFDGLGLLEAIVARADH